MLVLLLLFVLLAGLGIVLGATSDVLTFAWTRGGSSVTQNVTLTAEAGQVIDVSVPGSTTDLQVNVAIDVSQLTHIFLLSDGALTIQTNSGGSPDDTITLAASKPLVWYSGCGLTCPLTVDVTNLYLTNASGSAVALQIRLQSDATP